MKPALSILLLLCTAASASLAAQAPLQPASVVDDPPAMTADERAALERKKEAVVQELIRRLRPEYERRVRTDGKESADQWLRTTAWELGREAGRMARDAER